MNTILKKDETLIKEGAADLFNTRGGLLGGSAGGKL